MPKCVTIHRAFARMLVGAACLMLPLWTAAAQAQEPVEPPPAAPPPAPRPVPAASTSLAEKEHAFAQTMRGAALVGIWQMTGEGSLAAAGPLTEPKTERYTIAEASKVVDDQWLIQARIEVGDKDVTIPVPVRVLWAGDTPIIYVDRLPVPTMGTYSARVMIYRDFYSGTWVSDEKDYGGVMAGRVVRGESTTKPAANPQPK